MKKMVKRIFKKLKGKLFILKWRNIKIHHKNTPVILHFSEVKVTKKKSYFIARI